MRKIGWGCLILVVAVVASIVACLLVFNHIKNKRVQEEVDSVEQVLDEAANSSTPSSFSIDKLSEKENPATDATTEQGTIDLEKTIRLFHILDAGYEQSHNMQEYLHFLATQDYRGIPAEVINAKKKLIPYYKSLRRAEEDLSDAKQNVLWKAISENENLTASNSPLAAGIRVAATGGLDFTAISSLVSKSIDTGKEFYENLKKNEDIVKEAREALEEHRDAYLAYLEEYTKLYICYMAKWNRLCLMRDQAYIAISNGDIDGALGTLTQALAEFPGDREASLLKAYCLIYKAQEGEADSEQLGGLKDAKRILDTYIRDYPEKSAPALVLLGTYYTLEGDETKAKNMFDQSSIEYPRQSEELLDMYNSYKYRNYLTKSVEGHFVQAMYKSMMEGFGFFSPNFQKALVAYNKGDMSKAKEEIFRHFFRRGNQNVYDYLISDMKYVEQYMPTLLNMIFEEHSFLDLQTYNPTLSFSDKLVVKIENRSDRRLSNVRLFLCLHLTDMYKDEYLVKKMETTLSNIEPHSVADFGKLQLDYEIYGKKKDNVSDIVSARAIIMTDSLIIWVDEDKVKRTNILDRVGKLKTKNHFGSNEFFYMNRKWNGKNFVDLVRSGTSAEMKEKDNLLGSVMGSKNIVFHFPRILDGLNPFFSFGQLNNRNAILPQSVILNGDHIDVEFEKQAAFANSVKQLFISCAEGEFHLNVSFDEKGEVKGISEAKF